mgnify:CR=1 FL=1
MMRILKEELFWLREWTSPFLLVKELERWIQDYNARYLHSALGYKSPERFEMDFNTSRNLVVSPT